jgi:DNA-binding NarL/FixJ family response regulator
MSIKVLLVDDHKVVRDGLRFMLEAQSDIEIIGEASEGRKALMEVRKICPDVVIMDIAMPDLNGIEATKQIRETCPSTHVIILSMHSDSEHIYHALEAGARGYLLKESAGKEVIDAIRTVYSGKRYFSHPVIEELVANYTKYNNLSNKKSPIESLSTRELQVLQLVVEGKTSKEIADIIYLSPKTVDTYRSRLMRKLGTKDVPSLVKLAINYGLISS